MEEYDEGVVYEKGGGRGDSSYVYAYYPYAAHISGTINYPYNRFTTPIHEELFILDVTHLLCVSHDSGEKVLFGLTRGRDKG